MVNEAHRKRAEPIIERAEAFGVFQTLTPRIRIFPYLQTGTRSE